MEGEPQIMARHNFALTCRAMWLERLKRQENIDIE